MVPSSGIALGLLAANHAQVKVWHIQQTMFLFRVQSGSVQHDLSVVCVQYSKTNVVLPSSLNSFNLFGTYFWNYLSLSVRHLVMVRRTIFSPKCHQIIHFDNRRFSLRYFVGNKGKSYDINEILLILGSSDLKSLTSVRLNFCR